MLRQILSKQIIIQDQAWWDGLRVGYSEIVLDLGCGDGGWAYQYAKNHPEALVVGIDSDAVSFEKISHKASRKPAKGGLPNVVFFQAAAESLPAELSEQFNRIFINFPWGSLLAGVVRSEELVMDELARVAAPQAELNIFTTYESAYEPETIEKLELPALESLDVRAFGAAWLQHGWELQSLQEIDEAAAPPTSWWKAISHQRKRKVFCAQLVRSTLRSAARQRGVKLSH
jgi:16S rRNA (adenine(1408)-N(1))-methyltransferase